MDLKEIEKLSAKLLVDAKKDGVQKLVVGAVITIGDEVLLLKRASDDFMGGLVEIPSGGVDDGESIVDALKREVLEESGITISVIDGYIGSFDYKSGSGKNARQLNFKVSTLDTKNDIKLSEEHDSYYLANPSSELYAKLNISEKTRKTIATSFSEEKNQGFNLI